MSSYCPDQETEITLPTELERDTDGGYLCPAGGCDSSVEAAVGLTRHYYYAHDTSIPADCFGEETWVAYLYQEHIENGKSPGDIAGAFDSHIGKDRIREDLREAGIYGGGLPTGTISDSARILLRPDVETIKDAQRVAARERGDI